MLGSRSFQGAVPLRSRIGNVLTRSIMHVLLGCKLAGHPDRPARHSRSHAAAASATGIQRLRVRTGDADPGASTLHSGGGRAHPHHLRTGQPFVAFQSPRGFDEDLLRTAALRFGIVCDGAAGQPGLLHRLPARRARAGVAGIGARAGRRIQLLDGAPLSVLFAPAPPFDCAEVPGAGGGQRFRVLRRHPAARRHPGNSSGGRQADGGVGAVLRELRGAAAVNFSTRAQPQPPNRGRALRAAVGDFRGRARRGGVRIPERSFVRAGDLAPHRPGSLPAIRAPLRAFLGPDAGVCAALLRCGGERCSAGGHNARRRTPGAGGSPVVSGLRLRAGLLDRRGRTTRHAYRHGHLHSVDAGRRAAAGQLSGRVGRGAAAAGRAGSSRRVAPLRRMGPRAECAQSAPGGGTGGAGTAHLRFGRALAGGAEAGDQRRRAGDAPGHSRQHGRAPCHDVSARRANFGP